MQEHGRDTASLVFEFAIGALAVSATRDGLRRVLLPGPRYADTWRAGPAREIALDAANPLTKQAVER
jgi:hypothetical protein